MMDGALVDIVEQSRPNTILSAKSASWRSPAVSLTLQRDESLNIGFLLRPLWRLLRNMLTENPERYVLKTHQNSSSPYRLDADVIALLELNFAKTRASHT